MEGEWELSRNISIGVQWNHMKLPWTVVAEDSGQCYPDSQLCKLLILTVLYKQHIQSHISQSITTLAKSVDTCLSWSYETASPLWKKVSLSSRFLVCFSVGQRQLFCLATKRQMTSSSKPSESSFMTACIILWFVFVDCIFKLTTICPYLSKLAFIHASLIDATPPMGLWQICQSKYGKMKVWSRTQLLTLYILTCIFVFWKIL